MKKGWTNCKIGDICSITDFVSNGSFASLRENVKYYNSPNYAVLVRLADASNGFDKSKFVYTDEHGYDFSKKSHLHGGELIMSNVGSVGSMFICPVMAQPMTLAPNTISITSQNNKFLYYYFLSDGFKKKLKGITSSTTLKKFNKTNFKLLEIPIPPLSEQQSIVDYLDSAFAKIDAMKANAEKAFNEAKALFQASLKEMLEPKEGWEEKTLDDVCEIKSILVDPKEVQYKNLLHVGGANIVSETGELIDLKTAAEEELSSGKFTFNDKDVLYNKIRPYLIKVSRPDFSGLCSADMYPLTSKKGMTRDYLYYILVSRDFTDYAIMNSARAGMPKLNRQTLFAYKCMIPPLSEQQSIVTTLDSLKSKVDRLQENYNKISQECDALKQAILRQVFE